MTTKNQARITIFVGFAGLLLALWPLAETACSPAQQTQLNDALTVAERFVELAKTVCTAGEPWELCQAKCMACEHASVSATTSTTGISP